MSRSRNGSMKDVTSTGCGSTLIIGRPLRLLLPIGGHILAGIAKGIGAFDPDLFTLQGALEPLQDTELIVLPVEADGWA